MVSELHAIGLGGLLLRPDIVPRKCLFGPIAALVDYRVGVVVPLSGDADAAGGLNKAMKVSAASVGSEPSTGRASKEINVGLATQALHRDTGDP